MNIQQITQLMIDNGIEPNEATIETEMLLKHFCNYTINDKLKGKVLQKEEIELIQSKVAERIQTRNPIQYITGEAYFMGEFFKVSPSVLIPRDETELVVNRAVSLIQQNNFKQILDIGTGSGCIACTIAKRTDAVVLGTDISSDALNIALDNVTKLNINNKAVFRKSDLFDKIREDEKFDMIISNPPYIPENTELSDEVMHEPNIALFAKENGLYFYRKIIESAPACLNKNGILIFELGINEACNVQQMMEPFFTNITTEKDFAGIERIIFGTVKNIN